MSRPLVAALLSAVVASIAAFLILKRWELIGTLTGAVLFPLVYTLVSHWSKRGLDRTILALRKPQGEQDAGPNEEGPSSPGDVGLSDPPQERLSIPAWTRWLSIGLACVALGIGIYSMSLGSPTERVIVRERVIEREVASAVELTTAPAEPNEPRPETDPATTTSSVSTTSTTDETAPDADSSSSSATGPTDTVEPGETDGGINSGAVPVGSLPTSSTTIIGVGGQTTIPPTQTAP